MVLNHVCQHFKQSKGVQLNDTGGSREQQIRVEEQEIRTMRLPVTTIDPYDGLQCLDAIYGGNCKRQWTPEMDAIGHTHGRASSRANE
jgi:hypothetical protein